MLGLPRHLAIIPPGLIAAADSAAAVVAALAVAIEGFHSRK